MKLKFKALFVVVLLVTSVFSITMVFPVGSWHTPSSTEDGLYEEFGPRPSQLLINIYSDYLLELQAFKNKEIGIMDWGLEPIDYQWFETNDPTHSQYGTAFYNEFDMFEYDINCQVLPTSIVSVRQAFAHMVDKQYYVDTWLPNLAMKIDSVLGSLPNWYNPACTDRYNLEPRTTMTPLPDDPQDWEAAYNLLVSDLGEPIVDPEDPTYYTWTWASPFPNWDPTGAFPPVANGHLLMFVGGSPIPPNPQYSFFRDCCETAMPVILPTLGKPRARLHVDLYIVPSTITKKQVMTYYRYHLYTGGWSLSKEPDFLTYYTTAEIIKPQPNAHNYVMYSNPNFDNEVALMLAANSIGSSTNPCDALYHAYLAQNIMENDEPVIPMFTLSGYKAYLANWRGVVNQVGFGTDSWWTFLNARKVGSEGGDVIRYGWAGGLLSINVIGSTWLWDWKLLSEIYDSLIAMNPYNEAEDLPYIAKSWEIGTWNNGGTDATKITFHLREDAWWQDVPYQDRSAITFDNGQELDGPFTNMPLTPVDIAFSIEYIRDNVNSTNGWMAANVDHVGLNLDLWGSLWPYTATVPEWYDIGSTKPWQYDYVQHDATLDSEAITIYMNVSMPWLSLHRVGGIPITPMHVWKWILMSASGNIDTWAEDILYGTGPWILFSITPGVQMTLIPFTTGQTYQGLTLERSYFYQPVRPPEHENDGEGVNGMMAWVRNELHNYYNSPLTVSVYFDYDFEYWDGSAWMPIPGLSAGVTDAQVVTIAPGETARIEEPHVAKIPVNITWCKYIRIHDSMHWAYVDPSPLVWQAFTGYYGDFTGATPETTAYCSDVMHYHPGDIAGKVPQPLLEGYWSEPYLAADGVCDIKDVSVLGAHWQHRLPPLGDPHPSGTYEIDINDASGWCRRADINGDNIIDIKDISIIGANWQRSWTHNPPPYVSKDLGVPSFWQHKDTGMLCLDGCVDQGQHAWDRDHVTRPCAHCNMYCVRASIAMINRYFGGYLSQDRISYYIFGEGFPAPPEGDLGHGVGLNPGQTQSALWWALNGALIEGVSGKPTFAQIETWIDAGRPILRRNVAGDWHATVIDGYEVVEGVQYVHVIDPWTCDESTVEYNNLEVFQVWIPPADADALSDEPSVHLDSDSDGIVDFDEVFRFRTDPFNADTDGDEIPEKDEIWFYTFVSHDPDPDHDGARSEIDPDH